MNALSRFIARIHASIRGVDMAPHGVPLREKEVPRGLHKEYPRMPRIELPAPETLTLPLSEALHNRASFSVCEDSRQFSSGELGSLLGNALGMRTAMRRQYPSGGGLFPIETYLIGTVLERYPSGVFHYHPKAHALEFLWETSPSFTMAEIIRAGDTPFAPILVIFTSVWSRSSVKYAELAYAHGLIEAGHMAENILLAATALGIHARPLAGFYDEAVSTLLDLPKDIEQPVYGVLLCPSAMP